MHSVLPCALVVTVPLLLSLLFALLPSSPTEPCGRGAESSSRCSPLSFLAPPVLGCGGFDRECSGSSNSALIDNMVRRGLITSSVIAAAMKRVDRAHYVTRADLPGSRVSPSTSQASAAYVDSPQYIGFGATISAPHMHAMCTELMLPAMERAPAGEERRVLDVGSGSGYLAAVLSRVLGDTGRVYGVEHMPELVELSLNNLRADDPALLQRVTIQQGDGSHSARTLSGILCCTPRRSLTRRCRRCCCAAVQAVGLAERGSIRRDPRGRCGCCGAGCADPAAQGGWRAGNSSGRGWRRADAGPHREATRRTAPENDGHRRALRAPDVR